MLKKYINRDVILKTLLVLISLSLLMSFIIKKENTETEQRFQNEILRQLSVTRSEIENILYSRILLVRGVVSFIMTNPEITSDEYKNFCEKQLTNDKFIRNLTLIKGDVVQYVYPLQGNEKAVGTNISITPGQKDTFLKAKETGEIVMSGPLNLIQGGIGLIFRVPIFINKKYWGQASIVINIDEFYKEIFPPTLLENYHFILQGKNGLGSNGSVFYGVEEKLKDKPVSMTISLPGGQWVLHALPKKGWKMNSETFFIVLSIGSTLCVIILILFFYSMITNNKLKDIAYLDFLTDVPNRRLVKLHFDMASSYAKRYKTMFAVVVIDINDFKIVNDTLGHDAGDFYLVEFSNILKNTIRKNDFIFRIGGDEFLLFITGLTKKENIESIIANIKTNCHKTIPFRNTSIDFQFSMGYSLFPDDSENFDTLMVVADKKMYSEKKEFHKN